MTLRGGGIYGSEQPIPLNRAPLSRLLEGIGKGAPGVRLKQELTTLFG